MFTLLCSSPSGVFLLDRGARNALRAQQWAPLASGHLAAGSLALAPSAPLGSPARRTAARYFPAHLFFLSFFTVSFFFFRSPSGVANSCGRGMVISSNSPTWRAFLAPHHPERAGMWASALQQLLWYAKRGACSCGRHQPDSQHFKGVLAKGFSRRRHHDGTPAIDVAELGSGR